MHATSAVVVTSSRTLASKVDLAVMRFDGGSGSVMVSNGIPFPRGLVTESTLNQLHMFVNGVEQPVFTRALGGRWPDGSLRAALVQFDYVIPDARTIPAYFTVGGARTIVAPAERAAVPTPIAAALPASSAYLISTGLAGAVYDPSTTRAPTTLIAQYESDFARIAAIDWAQCGAAWGCGRTAGYDRPFILYQAWIRTANPTYWQHATAIVPATSMGTSCQKRATAQRGGRTAKAPRCTTGQPATSAHVGTCSRWLRPSTSHPGRQ